MMNKEKDQILLFKENIDSKFSFIIEEIKTINKNVSYISEKVTKNEVNTDRSLKHDEEIKLSLQKYMETNDKKVLNINLDLKENYVKKSMYDDFKKSINKKLDKGLYSLVGFLISMCLYLFIKYADIITYKIFH